MKTAKILPLSALAALWLTACGTGVAVDPAPRANPSDPAAVVKALRADKAGGVDDVVVIAVVDSSINPYHWDYLASKMPRHLDEDATNDLPLDQDPATWLKGHPGAAAFKSYEALLLTLENEDPNASTASLQSADAGEWSRIVYSEGTANSEVSYYWFPGTKIIGHVAFSGAQIGDPATTSVTGRQTGPVNTFAVDSHGIGTSSVSVGNIHGTCPNCVLVYVHGTSEQANEWIAQQDWIDLQTNSWGLSFTGALRDRIYAGSDTELQRTAVERGQAIFFSAGNGLENAFVTPNPTLFSSQEGPDWIITAGSVTPTNQASHSGHGKPADIASIGSGYPSATGGNGSTTAQGNFSGTSNSTPVLAGIWGAVLQEIRAQIGGGRMQAEGVIAQGTAGCGSANANCALSDGTLTVHELREAFFRAAQYSAAGLNVGGAATIPMTEQAEIEFLSEGHGHYIGRLNADVAYDAELDRILGYLRGEWFEEQNADQRDFMIAKSICRQGAWGTWDFGYASLGPAPAPSPMWPVRTFFTEACPTVIGTVVAAERLYASQFE